MTKPRRLPLVLIVLSVLAALGCSRQQEGASREKADGFFAAGKYAEAAVEYRNVLERSPEDGAATANFGICLFELGDYPRARDYLERALRLDPKSLPVMTKLGALRLIGGGAAEAGEIAAKALELDPRSLDAALLLASAAVTPEEIDRALQVLEQLRPEFGAGSARFHIAVAELLTRKGDPVGAEASLAQGTTAEPESAAAHLALGRFYVSQKDLARAEQELTAAAGKGGPDAPEKQALAEFYHGTGRTEEARKVLLEMTAAAPQSPDAWRRLAGLAIQENKYGEAEAALAKLFAVSPADPLGVLLRGEMALRRGDAATALADFAELVKRNPAYPPGNLGLARALLLAGRVEEARTRLGDLLATHPDHADGALLLALIHLRTGANDEAVALLEKLALTSPTPRVLTLLAAGYAKAGNPEKTIAAASRLAELEPDRPAAPYLIGIANRKLGRAAPAREAFERAYALAPEAIESLVQLVDMDFAARQPDAALARVEKEIAHTPQSGPLHFLLGDVRLRRGEPEAAEAAYLKTVHLTPGQTEAYLRLARVYAGSRKPEAAVAKIGEAIAAEPGNASLHMLLGTLQQQLGNRAKAIESFEKALELSPKLVPAANNLAYLYADEKGKEARALELADLARKAAPEDGNVNDTYGWVLYRQGQYQAALEPLLVAATKAGDNPEIQFHLGMAHFRLGNEEQSREALTRALATKQGADAPWAAEAKQTLAGMK